MDRCKKIKKIVRVKFIYYYKGFHAWYAIKVLNKADLRFST